MQKAKEAETLTMARMKHRAEVQDAGLLETLRNAYQLAADAGETEEAARLARAIRDTLLTHVDAHGSIYRLEMAAPDSKSFLDWLDWLKTLASVIASSEWARYRRALLDIPQQEGFPYAISWPVEPTTRKWRRRHECTASAVAAAADVSAWVLLRLCHARAAG